ncbi:MAG: SUMF1/EgtB/PvdO family nonheme iron enzyme, partial [Saprospiraceae bacterium]|nr:SUMF1/EgtB/PvdO family nonheme iron enzyme [Saprospiraceae bacterium]
MKYKVWSILSACALICGVSCGCGAGADKAGPDQGTTVRQKAPDLPVKDGMVLIPAGTLHMGGDNEQAEPNEFPKHEVVLGAFWMDRTEVTNAQYAEFVKATGYVTVAERPIDWEEMKKGLPPGTPKPPDSTLQPGALVFHPTDQPVPLSDPSLWWRWVIAANWKHPEGPGSSIADRMDH